MDRRRRLRVALVGAFVTSLGLSACFGNGHESNADTALASLVGDRGFSTKPPGASLLRREVEERCNYSSGDGIPPGVAYYYRVEDISAARSAMRRALVSNGWEVTRASTSAPIDEYAATIDGIDFRGAVDLQSGTLVVSAAIDDPQICDG